MHSKSKNHNDWTLSEPWIVSTFLHSILLFFSCLLFFDFKQSKKNDLEFEVFESPKVAPLPIQVSQSKAPTKLSRGHEVFGLNRRSISSEQGETIKTGNTIVKAPDQETLKPEDKDVLPIPSEEYLISKMPEMRSEVRVVYPSGPKKRGIQGSVIMDLLIDSLGKVREVTLVEGPDPELSEAATAAARGFEFTAALIQDKPVAVRIRYAYRFVLER